MHVKNEILDTTGLRCPQPILQLAVKVTCMQPGDILEVVGDCPTLERDVRAWCKRLGKVLLAVKENGNKNKIVQIKI
jgi:tRNA 2-thiouridine synthesizing protein A